MKTESRDILIDINFILIQVYFDVGKELIMDDWEKLNETSLPDKEDLYSNLNMEDITDADYMHQNFFCTRISKISSFEKDQSKTRSCN